MQTRRKFLGSATAGAAMMLRGSASAAALEMTRGQRLFIGTSSYSEFSGTGEGIFAASFIDGKLSEPRLLAKAKSPSFIAVPKAGHPLFAVLGGDGGQSQAASYAVSGGEFRTTTLAPISTASSGAGGGCHVSVSPDGACVFVANYGGASVASFFADTAGKLTQASFVKFPPDERGPVKDRQEGSHVHSAVVSPDGGFVLVNDLGLDRIHVFGLDRKTAKLLPHKPDHWASEPGAGPRHLVVHPNGKWIYCICELNSTVVQLEWSATQGALTTKSVISTLPAGVDSATARACEMVFSRDARFLYASNRRGSESFTVLSVDHTTGALTTVQNVRNPGLEARHIAIDPSGKWFLTANQFSGDVTVFALDTASGRIGNVVSTAKLSGPSCLVFA